MNRFNGNKKKIMHTNAFNSNELLKEKNIERKT